MQLFFFWTCSVSTAFWQDFKQWAVNRGELSNTINLTAYLVLGLNLNKNKRLDFYFLIARFFLWVCKTRNTFPKIENFSPFLSHYDTPRTNTYLTPHLQGHAYVFFSTFHLIIKPALDVCIFLLYFLFLVE